MGVHQYQWNFSEEFRRMHGPRQVLDLGIEALKKVPTEFPLWIATQFLLTDAGVEATWDCGINLLERRWRCDWPCRLYSPLQFDIHSTPNSTHFPCFIPNLSPEYFHLESSRQSVLDSTHFLPSSRISGTPYSALYLRKRHHIGRRGNDSSLGKH